MKTTLLGQRGQRISALGLGCMTMSHPGRNDVQSLDVLRRALDAGITLLDTADKYGKGHNERLVGRAVLGRRDDVMVATKVGFVASSREPRPINGTPDHIAASCDASLRRLGTDHIDLYYLHRVDPQVPIEESVGALAQLVDAGKVLQIGLCEVAPATLRRAHRVHPIAAVQSEYSLATRDPEEELLAVCRQLGATFVAYSPLGIGLLAGRVRGPDDVPPGSRLGKQSRLEAEHLAHNLGIVDALRQVALDLECTLPQLALAWLLAQDVVPIPSSSSPNYRAENIDAVGLELDAAVLERIEGIAPAGAFRGDRKSRLGMRLVGG